MIIKDFSVTALQEHSMWYLLKKQYQNEIDIVRPTAAGYEPWSDATAYRMFNGRILLGFSHPSKAVFAQGLVALGDGVTEHISTQAYERIEHLLDIPPTNEHGTFVFVDSQPVPTSLDWRCDVAYYGPMPFPDLNGVRTNPTEEKSVLLEFEPIISVPGLAHLVWLKRENFAEQRWQFVNNALTPAVTTTLSECTKLIHEWSMVSQPPFNNTEDIAVKANKFCDLTGLESWHVDAYPDMQIARFLSGDENARLRPADAIGPQEDLLSYVRQNMSYMSLASLLNLNPGTWDVMDVAELEQSSIDERKKAFYKDVVKTDYPEGGNIPKMVWNDVSFFLEPWFGYFDKAKDISKGLM